MSSKNGTPVLGFRWFEGPRLPPVSQFALRHCPWLMEETEEEHGCGFTDCKGESQRLFFGLAPWQLRGGCSWALGVGLGGLPVEWLEENLDIACACVRACNCFVGEVEPCFFWMS